MKQFEKKQPALVLCDVRMPGKSGLEILQAIQHQAPDAVVIMTTAVNEAATAVEALRLGAFDYLVKPITLDILQASVERAKERIGLKQEIERHKDLQREGFAEDVVVAS